MRYSRTSRQTPVWVTGQALMALARRPFPLRAGPRAARRAAPAPAPDRRRRRATRVRAATPRDRAAAASRARRGRRRLRSDPWPSRRICRHAAAGLVAGVAAAIVLPGAGPAL